MATIAAFDAKTHFASLLAMVAAGEEVTITARSARRPHGQRGARR
ncbi:MAG TPA: hypothetical protein VFC47_07610 [Caulobacteraceae bacterium]|nr:hypothetical protein [Caulobacteraceae bacterium]